LSLTPEVRIGVTSVVRNVPTSRLKDSEGELGELHLDDKAGSHSFVSKLSSFEVRSRGTRRSGILHVSSLESRASKVGSKSAGKGFSIDNSSSNTVKSSLLNVASEGLATASEPVRVQAIAETKSVDNFVHNADHLSFVGKDISSGSEISGTDDGLTNDGSIGSRSQSARSGLSNVIRVGVSFYHVEPISLDTRLEYGRSRNTADSTSTDFQASSGGILDLEGGGPIVHNGRDKLVLDVVSHGATRGTEKSVVSVGSKVGVTGESSS